MEVAYRLKLAADIRELEKLHLFVEEKALALHVSADALYDIAAAVNELVTNTIVHGYQGRPGAIELEMWCVADALHVRLRDAAPVFDPAQAPLPDVTSPLEQRPSGGLGIYMVRQFMDSMIHRALPQGGNELTLTKRGAIVMRSAADSSRS